MSKTSLSEDNSAETKTYFALTAEQGARARKLHDQAIIIVAHDHRFNRDDYPGNTTYPDPICKKSHRAKSIWWREYTFSDAREYCRRYADYFRSGYYVRAEYDHNVFSGK